MCVFITLISFTSLLGFSFIHDFPSGVSFLYADIQDWPKALCLHFPHKLTSSTRIIFESREIIYQFVGSSKVKRSHIKRRSDGASKVVSKVEDLAHLERETTTKTPFCCVLSLGKCHSVSII